MRRSNLFYKNHRHEGAVVASSRTRHVITREGNRWEVVLWFLRAISTGKLANEILERLLYDDTDTETKWINGNKTHKKRNTAFLLRSYVYGNNIHVIRKHIHRVKVCMCTCTWTYVILWAVNKSQNFKMLRACARNEFRFERRFISCN